MARSFSCCLDDAETARGLKWGRQIDLLVLGWTTSSALWRNRSEAVDRQWPCKLYCFSDCLASRPVPCSIAPGRSRRIKRSRWRLLYDAARGQLKHVVIYYITRRNIQAHTSNDFFFDPLRHARVQHTRNKPVHLAIPTCIIERRVECEMYRRR